MQDNDRYLFLTLIIYLFMYREDEALLLNKTNKEKNRFFFPSSYSSIFLYTQSVLHLTQLNPEYQSFFRIIEISLKFN